MFVSIKYWTLKIPNVIISLKLHVSKATLQDAMLRCATFMLHQFRYSTATVLL